MTHRRGAAPLRRPEAFKETTAIRRPPEFGRFGTHGIEKDDLLSRLNDRPDIGTTPWKTLRRAAAGAVDGLLIERRVYPKPADRGHPLGPPSDDSSASGRSD